MKLYYKNNEWEILAPNTIALFKSIVKSETSKNYMTIKHCAKFLYTIDQCIVVWGDDEYKKFIKDLPADINDYYMTINSNKKGQFMTINRNNINVLKSDFDFLFKLFSTILSSMILDRKNKLYIKG